MARAVVGKAGVAGHPAATPDENLKLEEMVHVLVVVAGLLAGMWGGFSTVRALLKSGESFP